MNDRVEIRVGGKTYGGWKSVVIEIGMDQLTSRADSCRPWATPDFLN